MRILTLFEQIAAIPHGSGNTGALSDFCADFARTRGFEVLQDPFHNCLIRVPASPGYEDHPTVILQGHLDMVCEQEPGLDHDFMTEGLTLRREDDLLSAVGTTLGGDDGIAICYGLALLEEPTPHPPLELLFTADEETGMDGALGLDVSLLQGRRMLNLDSEEEGQFIISSAGGKQVDGTLRLEREPCTGPVWRVTVEGLLGGHSGSDIHLHRGNANILLGRVLKSLPCRLIEASGGTKHNAIPRTAAALIAGETMPDAAALTALLRGICGDREPALTVQVEPAASDTVLTEKSSAQAIGLLEALPDGVHQMSAEIQGLPETSSNFAVLRTEQDEMRLIFSVRSMKNTERDVFAGALQALLRRHGAESGEGDGYPAWEYRADSPLRDTAVACFGALYGKEPKLLALHAGLESGIFADRLPGLDVISLGPDIWDIHTTRERLSVSSFARTWELLKAILAKL